MGLVHFLAVALSVFALHSLSAAQTCKTQRVFANGFANPMVCDGDAGGSQFTVLGRSIIYRVLGTPGGRPNVDGFPDVILPAFLKLFVARRPNGEIQPRKSFIQRGGKKYIFKASDMDTENFRLYFNVLQVLVKQFETGNCPIDSKGQSFPELASVRGGLLVLAAVFDVEDCSRGRV